MTNGALTPRALALGNVLHEAMQRKGWTGNDLGAVLHWSATKVSRLKTGMRRADVVDMAIALTVLDVVGPDRDSLLEFTAALPQPNWLQEHGQRGPGRLSLLHHLETAAARINFYGPDVVPPHLQVPAYTRSLVRELGPAEQDQDVAHRCEGQQRFMAAPPPARFFVGERALTHPAVPASVMSEQVHHLLRMAVLPNPLIRVVRESHTLPGSHPFTFMTFSEHRPLVCIEGLNTTAFLEREDTVAGYREVISTLAKTAMDVAATRTWLLDRATQLSDKAPNAYLWAAGGSEPPCPEPQP